jgi:hypothetical protein
MVIIEMENNYIFHKGNNENYFYLDSTNLELQNKYDDIYTMNYLSNILKIVPNNTNKINIDVNNKMDNINKMNINNCTYNINNKTDINTSFENNTQINVINSTYNIKNIQMNNINNVKTIYTYNDLIILIQIHFSTTNMLKYFGNKSNLNGKETRNVYKELVEYFLNLFLYKIQKIMNINIDNIVDKNDDRLCVIAQCLNIIRASIKKYIRLRTSDSMPYQCKKNALERRNRNEYRCSVPMKEFEYCPSFEYLKKKGKTCKQIITKSMDTNDMYTFFSKICISPFKKIKTIRLPKDKRTRYTKNKGTRKIYKTLPYVPKSRKITSKKLVISRN